jgi:hypothetical protein
MTVPAAPAQATSETLYYFSGLQSTLDGNCGIIQPVLQWGVSPAGGGSFWSVASWWWGWTGQFRSPSVTRVNVGDKITGYLTTTTAANAWAVSAYNQNGTQLSKITLTTSCRWNQAFPAVFEVDTSHPITNCSQISKDYIDFSNIALYDGFPTYNLVTYSPTKQFPIGSNGPGCGWGIGTGAVFATSTELWSTTGWQGNEQPTGCYNINPGSALVAGQFFQSCDGRFTLWMQTDGNLVLYFINTAIWASNTSNGKVALMQQDGNFVLYDGNFNSGGGLGTPVWASNTSGNPGAYLGVQNDGNLVVYLGPTALWASNTGGH